MRYIKWICLEGGKDMPIMGYSKIGDNDYEVEKFECFLDSTWSYSTSQTDPGRTRLGDQKVGSVEENNRPMEGTKKTIWMWNISELEYGEALTSHIGKSSKPG